jgi:hypothetical protein
MPDVISIIVNHERGSKSAQSLLLVCFGAVMVGFIGTNTFPSPEGTAGRGTPLETVGVMPDHEFEERFERVGGCGGLICDARGVLDQLLLLDIDRDGV